MTAPALSYEVPLMHALGWTLLHFLWEGAIIAALLSLVLRVLSHHSSQLRYSVACCALALMVASPLVTLGLLAANADAADQASPRSNLDENRALSFQGDPSKPARSWADVLAESFDHATPWILTAWFAGAILLLCRLNLGLIVAGRMRSRSTQAAPTELQMVFHDLHRRLGIERPVTLVNSVLVQVPTVIGWLRPTVLIPVGCLTGLSTVQIEAIFAHELAHIRRHDYLVSVFQSLIEAVLFYHPAVWWVSRQVRREREGCCDDLAVRMSGDALAYAKALSFLEERRSSVPIVALAANGGVLAMRIRRLLGYREPQPYSWLATATLVAVGVGATALCLGTFAGAQSNPTKQSLANGGAGSQTLSAPYQQWVDEDVLWIITPKERAQFMALSTNDERDEFIRQFWQRRDAGMPGVDANSFRGEHYRRLAYANQHFAASLPGWKTDRGRIYIMYGPPHSIEAHTVGTAKPYELWHYREIREFAPAERDPKTSTYQTTIVTRKDVDMKFLDTCGCGEFLLQSPRSN